MLFGLVRTTLERPDQQPGNRIMVDEWHLLAEEELYDSEEEDEDEEEEVDDDSKSDEEDEDEEEEDEDIPGEEKAE